MPVAALLALVLLFPASAAAHAQLLSTTPADGATVEGTPAELIADFDDPLEPESSLSIRNAAGERLAVGRVDPGDATRLIISDIPELAPGTYQMRWTAATADGHIERGTWSFTVAEALKSPGTPAPSESAAPSAAPSASASAQPSATATPSAAPSASPAPTDQNGASSSDVVLPIIAALAIVLLAAGYLLSRRRGPSDGV
jgi:methionine-rich copper-binding protein CopC